MDGNKAKFNTGLLVGARNENARRRKARVEKVAPTRWSFPISDVPWKFGQTGYADLGNNDFPIVSF